ncbi:MAG: hypothetical protein JKY02_08960 [Flavobacteriaceae bacterium]|nr:hypothetical protein [Flavobacteriaceae bacterium]
MKHIYKLSLLVLAVFSFTACAIDDDAPVVDTQTSLVIGLNQTGNVAVPNTTTSYDLTVNFSKPIPDLSRLFYTVDGVENSVDFNTGAITGSLPLTFTAAEITHEVILTRFIVINSAANNSVSVVSDSNTARVSKEGAFQTLMSWPSAANDLDLGLQPMTAAWGDTFAWIDTSLGITNTEFVEGLLVDGNYALFIQHFTAASSVDVQFDSLTAAGPFTHNVNTTADGNVLWFTKTTEADGSVSYVFYTQDPA